MRALLTGGHGFVGTHLVDRLLEAGSEVACLYRRPGEPTSLAGKRVEIVRGDIRDRTALRAAVAGVDEVYHLAALTRSLTPRAMFETNTAGTRRLLEALVASGFSGRFVFCSSIAAVGPAADGTPHDEARPRRPITWYGESKAAAEDEVQRFSDQLEVTVVRPPAVYGPRDTDFLTLFQAVQRGLAPVVGGLDRLYSLVHGTDLAAGIVAAARAETTRGGTYFVTHGRPVTQGELIAAAEAAIGRSARRIVVPASFMRLLGEATELSSQLTGRASVLGRQRMREVSTAHWVCRGDALERDAGWRADIDLVRGFDETVAWYRDIGRLRSRRDR